MGVVMESSEARSFISRFDKNANGRLDMLEFLSSFVWALFDPHPDSHQSKIKQSLFIHNISYK